jgi:hypothetical protein
MDWGKTAPGEARGTAGLRRTVAAQKWGRA